MENNLNTTHDVVETQQPEMPIEQPVKKSPSSFFKNSSDPNIADWVKNMQKPREQIETPEFIKKFDEEKEAQLPGDSEDKMREWLDFNDGHLKTSMWMQNNLDMGIAFMLSLRSGEEAEKYMAFKKQTTQTQQQYELGAALVKKYQAKLSLEMMFITGMAMLYMPIAYQAEQDRNANIARAQKQKEETQRTIKIVKDNGERDAA